MTIFHWILLSGFMVCFITCLYLFLEVVLKKRPIDYSKPAGEILPSIIYSYTGAMSPSKKESAYLHLPTYTAGMVFHIGTFLGFFLILFQFLGFTFNYPINLILAIFLLVSGSCGLFILGKRFLKKDLKALSNPDDYLSNILVTGFQLFLLITLLYPECLPSLFIYTTILLLYIPFGKLRHTVYFFTSRFQLGLFYGRRGIWPLKKN